MNKLKLKSIVYSSVLALTLCAGVVFAPKVEARPGDCRLYTVHQAFGKGSGAAKYNGTTYHMTKYECDCGAAVLCTGMPARLEGPYMEYYSGDFTLETKWNSATFWTLNSLHYSSKPLEGWDFYFN